MKLELALDKLSICLKLERDRREREKEGAENNMYICMNSPIGAWEVKLEIMTDKKTNQPTDRRT